MAKVLDDHEFRRGPKPEVSFDEYETGVIYKLEKGVDFAGSADSLRNRLYHFARSRGLEVSTQIEGDAVIFQLTKTPS
jgi:hypothetical protein